jgi:hypothetical protein
MNDIANTVFEIAAEAIPVMCLGAYFSAFLTPQMKSRLWTAVLFATSCGLCWYATNWLTDGLSAGIILEVAKDIIKMGLLFLFSLLF